MEKILLYWFNSWPNVGDAASPFIISELSRRKIVHRRYEQTFLQNVNKLLHFSKDAFKEYVFPFQKVLFGIGSILDYANSKVIVWGSGFREYESIYKGGQVLAVRGHLSLEKLPSKDGIVIGDPAILLPLIVDGFFRRKKIQNAQLSSKIKIVAHYRDYEKMGEKWGHMYKFVDIRTTDVLGFIQDLRCADYVLSTSLHGLIIAHSFGIPALWIYHDSIRTGNFKFHDYFSSVGIPLYDGFSDLEAILTRKEWPILFNDNKNKVLPHKNLMNLAKDLLRCAPFELNEKYKKMI